MFDVLVHLFYCLPCLPCEVFTLWDVKLSHRGRNYFTGVRLAPLDLPCEVSLGCFIETLKDYFTGVHQLATWDTLAI